MNLTSKQVKTFFKRYSKETGVRFVNASPLRRLLNRALRRVQDKYMKILDPLFDRAFCPKCIKPGLAIISFKPGCESIPLSVQVAIAVEEAEHSDQMADYVSKGGRVTGWFRDYFNPAERGFCALNEGAAKCSAGEVAYFLSGAVPEPPELSFYVVGDSQKLSDETYRINIDRVRKMGPGSSTFQSARTAIEVLRSL